jgi:hypothetical protein
MYRRFPRRQYRRRNVIESVFSAIKRKFSTRAPGRSLLMQRRQAFLLGLTFNLYRLRGRSRRNEHSVHFEDVTFDYRIQPGASSTRNAIALLRMMKYPEALVADAMAMVDWQGGHRL